MDQVALVQLDNTLSEYESALNKLLKEQENDRGKRLNLLQRMATKLSELKSAQRALMAVGLTYWRDHEAER